MGLTRLRAEQISDIDYKQAVRVITVTNVTLSGGAPSQVDSVNLSAGDRVLVNGQSTGSQNGIYEVQTVGTGSNGTWIRSLDTNATGELQAGTIVMVTEGTVYADTQWKLTTNNPIVIGTTALIFEQNSAFAFGNVFANGTAVLANTVGDVLTLTAGNNIQITGNNAAKSVTIAVTGISLNSISNGTSNVNVVSSGGNVTVGVGGTANVAEFSTGGLKVTGFASATGNVTGGNLITAGLVTATGNVTGGNILTSGLISATSNITSAANVTGGNITTAGLITASGNITGGNLSIVGNATISGNLSVTGNATLSGNILGDRIINGNTSIEIQTASGNANISVGGISNVATFTTAGLVANSVAATNNGAGTNFKVGDDTWLGDINLADTLSIRGQQNAANAYIVFGNADGIQLGRAGSGPLTYGGAFSAAGNVTGGNLLTLGQISATGNVTGNFFIGNGAFLTGLSAGSSNGIANGATSISIPVASGNITMGVTGQANTVVINLGSLTMYGTFAGPKTLNANVAVANAVNAVIFGPVTVNDGYNISIPDASTLYTYSGA